jgi:Zn-dependent protease
MSTTFIILAVLTGLCAAGFMLGSVIHLHQLGSPSSDERRPFRVVDLIDLLSGGVIAVLRGWAMECEKKSDARELAVVGGFFLGASVLFALLAWIF